VAKPKASGGDRDLAAAKTWRHKDLSQRQGAGGDKDLAVAKTLQRRRPGGAKIWQRQWKSWRRQSAAAGGGKDQAVTKAWRLQSWRRYRAGGVNCWQRAKSFGASEPERRGDGPTWPPGLARAFLRATYYNVLYLEIPEKMTLTSLIPRARLT
jgi:hypothetical protein